MMERDGALRLIDALAAHGFECMLRVKRVHDAPVYEVSVELDEHDHRDLPQLEAAIKTEPGAHGHIVGGVMEIS